MSRIELPDDAWAEIRDPKKVPERLRRPAKAASFEMYQSRQKALEETASTTTPAAPEGAGAWGAPPTPEPTVEIDDGTSYTLEQIQASVDAGIIALVSAWSFGDEVSEDVLLDLPSDAYDALVTEVTPLIGEMFQTLEPSTDPASPS